MNDQRRRMKQQELKRAAAILLEERRRAKEEEKRQEEEYWKAQRAKEEVSLVNEIYIAHYTQNLLLRINSNGFDFLN